jgi:hypothetical protein
MLREQQNIGKAYGALFEHCRSLGGSQWLWVNWHGTLNVVDRYSILHQEINVHVGIATIISNIACQQATHRNCELVMAVLTFGSTLV